jgi:anti-anti-sigma factor
MPDPSVNGPSPGAPPPERDSVVEIRTEPDGSLVIRPAGAIDADQAVPFRQLLVHAVRKVRPLRLVVDLGDVHTVDPINLGTLTALCGLADDHQITVLLTGPTAELRAALLAAGVPAERIS